MSGGAAQMLELAVLLLLVFVALFAAIARRLQIPYPIALVIAGLILGFVPGIPRINLDPDIVFFVLLPPLLYAAAWTTSWRGFSFNLTSIVLFAGGPVAVSVGGRPAVSAPLLPRLRSRVGGWLWGPGAPAPSWRRGPHP